MRIMLAIKAGDPAACRVPLLAIALASGKAVPRDLARLDRATGGAIARAVKAKDFKAGRDETLLLYAEGVGPQRVMLIGMGLSVTAGGIGRAAAIAGRRANAMGVQRAAFWVASPDAEAIESIAAGASLGAWEYRELKTQPPASERPKALESLTILVAKLDAAGRAALANGRAIAEGHIIARTLAMMPGNLCTPEYIAATAQAVAKRHGLKCTVRGRKEMRALGMGSFLAVAQGTPQDPKLIVMEYNGGGSERPICLVGKGLCFDSGGISIKPADRMEWMKFDMCGAAGVIGAMEAIARMKLKINVVGLVGSTTNMPSGTAMNPGDVVKALNGKTIEIINTDAEGRLVLADLLSYAAREFKPQAMIDAATLTGAVVVALGNTATGVMGTDQKVVDELLAAGRRAGEPSWQLPMWDEYKDQIKSDIADVKNIGSRGGGAITAAIFLAEFIEGAPWAHLDIAGTAYTEMDLGIIGRGPTGVPVRTFVEFVRGRAR
ncbi:putative cytosol aminopeptidase [Gemmatimonadota bacterium]|nr:putative cytosol aminopeptidase [Gemmatimonadota bacterium]